MAETLYEIVFQGRLVEGFSTNQVKANIARLFQATPAQIERLFSGNRVVIRNRLDQVSALKYQALMRKQGALCQIHPMPLDRPAPAKPTTEAAPKAPTPTPAPAQPLSEPAGRLPLAGARTDQILAGLDWSLAPPGARLTEPQEAPEPAPPRVDHLSLAPVGERLSVPEEPATPPPPNLDHLSVVPIDTDPSRSRSDS